MIDGRIGPLGRSLFICDFHGQFYCPLALAAYMAGYIAVRKWKRVESPMPSAIVGFL